MRLKQVRVSDHSCKGAAGLQNQYHYCYGKLRRRTTDEQPFGRCDQLPEGGILAFQFKS